MTNTERRAHDQKLSGAFLPAHPARLATKPRSHALLFTFILACALAFTACATAFAKLETNAPVMLTSEMRVQPLAVASSFHPLIQPDGEGTSGDSAENASSMGNASSAGTASSDAAAAASASSSAASSSADASSGMPLTQATVYYLTDIGQATPAKLQSPWGSCWAFAIAAALESSILKAEDIQAGTNPTTTNSNAYSEPNLIALNTEIDLSERHIAWFAHIPQTEASGQSQAGEGFSLFDPADPLNQLAAGNFIVAETALTSGQGLLLEATVPYLYNGYSGDPLWFSTGLFEGAPDDARRYDWAVDESLRLVNDTGWHVREVLELASPAINEIDPATRVSQYQGYNAEALPAIKAALVDVGAVAIALEVDESLPQEVARGNSAQAEPTEHFTYTSWAQYNSNTEVLPNHAATIVGWNDSFSASNFAGTKSGQPPADGAWLCKNNWGNDALFNAWGAADEANRWGLPANADGTGDATGFFWLSYYDHSIMTPVAFKVERTEDADDAIYQYDFLGPSEYQKPASYRGAVEVANMFTATEMQLIDSVSAWTFSPNESVDVTMYTIPHSASDTAVLALDESQTEGYDRAFDPANAETVFATADAVSTQTASFATAGFHKIDLDEPVLVSKGQRFIVAQTIHTTLQNLDGSTTEGSYLSLEVSFTDRLPDDLRAMYSTVIINPGESFVQVTGNAWETVQEYNNWYSEMNRQSGEPDNIRFGNALIKAYANDTTMAQPERIYQVVPLTA